MYTSNDNSNQQQLIQQAASELETLRCLPAHKEAEFPAAARALLYSLEGNARCVDCGAAHPQWASVSFGTLLCLQCSGKHRSLGVATSFVRSIDMDTWSHGQVLRMLEGGNAQLQQFFDRHQMGTLCNGKKRYETKAARFYRTHLARHAKEVAEEGRYQGREAVRQKVRSNSPSPPSTTTTSQQRPTMSKRPSLVHVMAQ